MSKIIEGMASTIGYITCAILGMSLAGYIVFTFPVTVFILIIIGPISSFIFYKRASTLTREESDKYGITIFFACLILALIFLANKNKIMTDAYAIFLNGNTEIGQKLIIDPEAEEGFFYTAKYTFVPNDPNDEKRKKPIYYSILAIVIICPIVCFYIYSKIESH